MTNRSQGSTFQLLYKLFGRENYLSWAVDMRAYWEIKNLWDKVEAPTNGTPRTDSKKSAKARGRMVLAVQPEVFPYIENALTPKAVWDELRKNIRR